MKVQNFRTTIHESFWLKMIYQHRPGYQQWHSWHFEVCKKKKKVTWSRYRPGVTQRVGRGIALLFHDRGSRRGWMVSSTTRPHFTRAKDPVPILQEAWWAPGRVWTGGKSRPHRDSIPDRPARSQSLYRLSYPAHILRYVPGCNRRYSARVLWYYTYNEKITCRITWQRERESN